MKKLSSILLALTLGFGTVYAETVTIKQSSTITKDRIVELSKEELAEVNKLSAELKNSGLSIDGLNKGKEITAEQATKLNRIVAIIEKDSLAAATLGGSSAAATTGFAAGGLTLAGLSAALLTAIALGSSDSSASTHSHH